MTTNVMDHRNRKVTSDSRWSIADRDFLYFVDDTGFDKIEDRASAVMICAGNAGLIEQWRTWFIAGDFSVIPPTEVELANGTFDAIYVTIISKPSFTIDFSSGLYHAFQDDAHFCGSGAEYAKDCYSVNGCAIRCIESAKASDPQTGGEIKYYEFDSFQNNLSAPPMSLAELIDELFNRGMVMNIKTRNITSMNPMDKDSLKKALGAGTVSLSAPTGQAPRAWTDREKQDVQEAMKRIVEREKAANS